MGREMDAIENMGEEHTVNGEDGEGSKGESGRIERGMMRGMRGMRGRTGGLRTDEQIFGKTKLHSCMSSSFFFLYR